MRQQTAEVSGCIRAHPVGAGTPKSENRRRHTGHAYRLFDEHHDERTAQSNLRRRHSRGPCRHILRRNGEGRAHPVLQHLQRFRTTCLRQHHTRHRHTRAAGRSLPRQGRTGGRRRGYSPRSLRHVGTQTHPQPDHRIASQRARFAQTDVHRAAAGKGNVCHSLPKGTRFDRRLALSVAGSADWNRNKAVRRRQFSRFPLR